MTEKSRSIQNLEERMEGLEPSSFRYQILSSARDFKSSWIDLGQRLFTVYKDKLYKDWGYLTFEAYCSKEIGIKQTTAVKMLKSYSFLEREEPSFLKEENLEERKPARIPSFESVNALRLAKESERLSETKYEELREDVFEGEKEDGEIQKKIRYVLKAAPRPAGAPDKADEDKAAVLKKLLAQLEQAKSKMNELEVPAKVLRQMEALIESLEAYRP